MIEESLLRLLVTIGAWEIVSNFRVFARIHLLFSLIIADQLSDYFENVQKVVEDTFEINSKRKVNIICHSLGCLRSVHFLNTRSVEWRNKYIHGYVSLAAPWGGSTEALQSLLLGANFNIPLLNINKFRDLERTFPSIVELLPRNTVWKDKVIVQTPKKKWTANDYQEIFDFVQCEDCKVNFHDVVMPNIAFPEVNITCIFGKGVTTPSKYKYFFNNPDIKPYAYGGDGDGVVNSISLEYCSGWKKSQSKYRVNDYALEGINHGSIIDKDEIIDLYFEYL